MEKKMRKAVSVIGTVITTSAVVSTVSYITGLGAANIINHAFPDGLPRWQAHMMEGVILTGGLGIGVASGMIAYPYIKDAFDTILDILPPLPEMKEVKDNG